MHTRINVLIAVLLSSLSVPSAFAGLITYAGYTHDDTTDIVTGGGLEWLQWDVTVGQSIDSALAAYSADGWRTASNVEMAALFNAFDFGFTFDDNENTAQSYNAPLSGTQGTESGPFNFFLTLFGETYPPVSSDHPSEPQERTFAWFGQDLDGDGLFNLARVDDDWLHCHDSSCSSTHWHNAFAGLSPDNWISNTSSSLTGVALVREYQYVPEPGSLPLLGLGLLGLIWSRRKVREVKVNNNRLLMV